MGKKVHNAILKVYTIETQKYIISLKRHTEKVHKLKLTLETL